ncbi:unnamed protein product [Nippostrongylus brasiliensis]|uniref:SERPIN domain-containing protein n=1 Tax=Nippostrongylus brasiliensis TaxID=27835 RepID=A0A158QYV3_NIPBR|nr:unnamed protein product [Nippostrongylus brasiliensis]
MSFSSLSKSSSTPQPKVETTSCRQPFNSAASVLLFDPYGCVLASKCMFGFFFFDAQRSSTAGRPLSAAPASVAAAVAKNCTRDTDIIDQLLNGTGYNKFRIPGTFTFFLYDGCQD